MTSAKSIAASYLLPARGGPVPVVAGRQGHEPSPGFGARLVSTSLECQQGGRLLHAHDNARRGGYCTFQTDNTEELTLMALPPRELNFPPELNFLAPVALDDLVRVGRDSDGGYVIPKTLIDETDFLVSFGIAKDWSFESDFLSLNPRIRIHAYDHTISRAFFLKQILRSLDGRLFRKSGLSEFMHRVRLVRDYSSFFSGNAKHYQQRVHNRNDSAHDATIKDIIGRTDSNRIFVKMDIEGGEYRVIRDLLSYSSRIIGMAVEFHGTDPLRETFVSCIRSFQSAYEIAHLHGNNYSAVSADGVPECLEITFIRKDFVAMSARRSSLPVPGVDRPSTERKPDFRISFKA